MLRERGHVVTLIAFSRPPRWVKRHYGGSDQWVIHRKKHAKFDVSLAIKLYRTTKSRKADIIHAHCETSAFYAGLIGKLCGISSVGTFHRSELRYYEPTWRNRLLYFFLNSYIAVSQERKNRMVKTLGLPEQNMEVIHWGIEPDLTSYSGNKVQMRETLGLPDCPIIFSLGHLGVIKGHDDSIAALSKVKKRISNAKLYIAGDGLEEDHERLHLLIEDLKLQDSVILLGQITNSMDWMQACDIFLQPSHEEAFGLVFLEAGICRKPTVSTRIGGIPEIVSDGETGYLVNPRQPEQLAEKLIELLSSDEKIKAIGDAACLRVQENFALSKQVDKLEQHFKAQI